VRTRAAQVLVRRAHADDLPRLLGLLRACVAQMQGRGIDQWDDVYPSEATLRDDLEAGTLFIGAALGHPLAGAFVVNERPEPEYAAVAWRGRGRAEFVHRLMVDPACQRRGVARQLMGFAELTARRRGRGALRLDAFTGNAPSLRLYRALGYADVGEVRFRKGLFRCFEKDLGPSRAGVDP